ncbi:MAG: hypothetical protein U1E77_18785 [Inhella sp.]
MHAQDLPGLTRLLTEATLGVTDIVEAMHARIASPPLLPAGAGGHTAGLTRQVYGAVRGVYPGVGKGLDLLLARLPVAPGPELQPPRRAWLAALNGVLGDHLQRSANPGHPHAPACRRQEPSAACRTNCRCGQERACCCWCTACA